MGSIRSIVAASMMAIGTITALYMIIAAVRVELKKRRSGDEEEEGDMQFVVLTMITVIGILIALAKAVLTIPVS